MATFDSHKNFCVTTVATAPTPASSGVTIVVADASQWSGTGAHSCTVWPAGTQPTTANAEIVRVTGRVGNTFTVTRAQEGSSARTILSGDQIAMTVTAKSLTDIEATLADLSSNGLTYTGAFNGSTVTASGAVTSGGTLQVNGKIYPQGGSGVGPNITLEASTLILRGDTGGVAIKNVNDSVTNFSISDAGVVRSSVAGNHVFTGASASSNAFSVVNTNSGTGAQTFIIVGNDATAQLGSFYACSSGFSTSGVNIASGVAVSGSGVGGLQLAATSGSGSIRLFAGGITERARVHASGGVSIGNTSDPGAAILSVGASSDATMGAGGFSMPTWPTTATAANANVANGAAVKLVTSLRAAKFDIKPISVAEARKTVMGLEGVTYRSAIDNTKRPWAGFIADDVEQANPTLASYNDHGKLQSVTYDRVPAYLVPLVQDHEKQINSLKAEISSLKGKL